MYWTRLFIYLFRDEKVNVFIDEYQEVLEIMCTEHLRKQITIS